MSTKPNTQFSDDMVNHHLDAVLRASGSALRHYSMEKTLSEMREAMREAMRKAMVAAIESAHSTDGLSISKQVQHELIVATLASMIRLLRRRKFVEAMQLALDTYCRWPGLFNDVLTGYQDDESH